MVSRHVDAWLAEQQVRVVDGLIVTLDGTAADVAERVLSATGRAMAIDELAAWTRPGGLAEATADVERRLRRDRRFVRLGSGHFELAEWGSEIRAEADETAADSFGPVALPPWARDGDGPLAGFDPELISQEETSTWTTTASSSR